MAHVIVTFKIMPESPEVNIQEIQEQAKVKITEAKGQVNECKEEPVAFGLKAVMLTMVRDESLGGTDDVEDALSKIEGVNSVQVENVSRTLG